MTIEFKPPVRAGRRASPTVLTRPCHVAVAEYVGGRWAVSVAPVGVVAHLTSVVAGEALIREAVGQKLGVDPGSFDLRMIVSTFEVDHS